MRRSLALGLIIICIMTGCYSIEPRKPLTEEGFQAIMEQADFTIIIQDGEVPENVKQSVIADNNRYQVEYYQFIDAETARNICRENVDKIEAATGDTSTKIDVTMQNYSYFYLTANDIYYVVSQIDDTLVYIEASNSYKSEIQELVKTLGY